MGTTQSFLATEDIAHLQQSTHFSIKELEDLYLRFERLDRDRSGTLSAEEILGIPEFATNPLTPRILDLLEINSGELDFTGFVQLLSIFHPKATKFEKLDFTFRVFNISGDGFIKRDELLEVLRMMVGHNLEEEELQAIVEQTFLAADINGDGAIDFNEFKSGMIQSNTLSSMTIAF